MIDSLIEKIEEKKNPTVLGLDPSIQLLPQELLHKTKRGGRYDLTLLTELAADFLYPIIDAVSDIVPAVKPQLAYFEQLGSGGLKLYADVVSCCKKKGLYVIADCKRGDIGDTMQSYTAAHIGVVDIENDPAHDKLTVWDADSMTVNPYFGTDGVAPAIKIAGERGKSLFILVKTSNPSGAEIQNLRTDKGEFVYEAVAELVKTWGAVLPRGNKGYDDIGAVVGATYPEEIAALRARCPHTFFLIPGYGAQGGSASGVAAAFDENRRGAVVNNSRGILGAYKKENGSGLNFAEAARRAAIAMRDDLRSVLSL